MDASISVEALSHQGDLSYFDSDEEIPDDTSGDFTSFRDISFKSEEMRQLLKLEQLEREDKFVSPISYDARNMFPSWILRKDDPEWKLTSAKYRDKISEVMQTPYNQRSQEQVSTLIHWLMTVWETANRMGFKRCGAMTKVFHYLTYEPGENIITEGERGLTFYIIISGTCIVHKKNIGTVATISKGQSFGEIALTEGKDLRTATVQAQTKVELLRLHKGDYDHFVKDIQLAERRENLQVLKSCQIFKSWSRMKIQQIVNTVIRRSFLPGEYIFKQGEVPDCVYVIVDGFVSIIKEIHIAVRNRWPVGMHEWNTVTKKTVKPYCVCELKRGAQFGEQSVVKGTRRSATARARTKVTVLCLDKKEFMHMLKDTPAMAAIKNFVDSYVEDSVILNSVTELKGGPSTTAQLNDYVITACDMSEVRPASPSISIVEEPVPSPRSPTGISTPGLTGAGRRGRRSSLFRIQVDALNSGDKEHRSIPLFSPEIKKDGNSFFSHETALVKSKEKLRSSSINKKSPNKDSIGSSICSMGNSRLSRHKEMFQFRRTTSSTERFMKQYNAALDATAKNSKDTPSVVNNINKLSTSTFEDDGRKSLMLSDTSPADRNAFEMSEVLTATQPTKSISKRRFPSQKRLLFSEPFTPIKESVNITPTLCKSPTLHPLRPIPSPIKVKVKTQKLTR